jgi:hypothetical protein
MATLQSTTIEFRTDTGSAADIYLSAQIRGSGMQPTLSASPAVPPGGSTSLDAWYEAGDGARPTIWYAGIDFRPANRAAQGDTLRRRSCAISVPEAG